ALYTDRVLTSFPTRRSSDLSSEEIPGEPTGHSTYLLRENLRRQITHGQLESTGEAIVVNLDGDLRMFGRWLTLRGGHDGRLSCRSEEHTSELQSLRHVVCRL